VSLLVNTGETVCLVGQNGAGKSTLIHLLAGLIYPNSGEVSVFGLDRWKESYEIRKRSIVVPAEPPIGSTYCPYDYLKLISQVYGLSADEFQSRLHQLSPKLNYTQHLKKRWHELSLGLGKKAALLGAFIAPVELRIFDEPFAGGIDPLGMEVLYEWFAESKQRGETILFSTQVLDQAEAVSDRIVLLNQGEVTLDGSPAEFIKKAGTESEKRPLYKAFVNLTGKQE